MTPSVEVLLAVLGAQSIVLVLSLVWNWRLTELAHQREIRIEGLIPVDALKTLGEAAIAATKSYTDTSAAKWDDFAPGALQKLFDFALGEVQRERSIEVTLPELVLGVEESDEGLG